MLRSSVGPASERRGLGRVDTRLSLAPGPGAPPHPPTSGPPREGEVPLPCAFVGGRNRHPRASRASYLRDCQPLTGMRFKSPD